MRHAPLRDPPSVNSCINSRTIPAAAALFHGPRRRRRRGLRMFDLSFKIGASRLRRDGMDRRRKPQSRGTPRLERRNAIKNIEYDASSSWSSSSTPSSDLSPTTLRTTRSLDVSPSSAYSTQTSFRIGGGVEGEVDLLYRSLGLSGPEDFAIPAAAWEARKARSGPLTLPSSRFLLPGDSPSPLGSHGPPDPSNVEIRVDESRFGNKGAGIRGVRPPILSPPTPLAPSALAPPPSRSGLTPPLPPMFSPVLDRTSSTWDILRSFAPDGENGEGRDHGYGNDDGDDEEEEEVVVPDRADGDGEEVRLGETAEDLFGSTSNYDDSSSTTTEVMFVISPNGKFKKSIKPWMKGALLGSGSYGTVYEVIANDGTFYAVKEVSLLDQGINAKQCIVQLEQEIALLSHFEHENIVQYHGTDKEEAKLFIFLELVTQGSLASLYQKYHLRDSQVSAYTRQILHGLKYLHDRNVVHRDIKCANILVHANGSVKLADFGLAKEITNLNVLKSCKGSVYWMAPEVVNPKRTYGPSADIWSLGCTVLEMLTRQIPYPNLEWTQALFRIGRGEKPTIPNSLSKDAQDFISQCVQVKPDDRPSAAQLLEHPFVRRSLPDSEFSESSSHSNGRWS